MAGMGHGGMGMMRSFRRDQEVLNQRVQRATLRRMITFARPYRRMLVLFLTVVILDSFVVVANPLILRQIINLAERHPSAGQVFSLAARHSRVDDVIGLAVLVAGDLDCYPAVGRERSDQPADQSGFAYATVASADNNGCHT